jgi:hypothetical protein
MIRVMFAERTDETLADTTQNSPRIGASATIMMHEFTLATKAGTASQCRVGLIPSVK